MKILAISKIFDPDGKPYESAIDLWRIKRPMLELAKHVDWQIDFQPNIVRNIDDYDDPDLFIKEHGEEEVDHLGQYDIIFTSYFTSPHVYTLLWGANKKHGTKFILDIDDDMYDVDPENPFWLAAGQAGAHFLRMMAKITKYISTTNQDLADKFKQNSGVDASVFVNPNYITDDYPVGDPNNEDKVVVGWFGGASHYHDLHETGVLEALAMVMHEHKEVYFRCAGQPVDVYLPKKRVELIDVMQGVDWPRKLFPSLKFDIALGPLRDTVFNGHKSNIKWQESTRMGAAFIGSNVGPYKSLKFGTAWPVPNTRDAWYIALKDLVENSQKRKAQVAVARKELESWRLENNWQDYKKMFEEVLSAAE